MIQITRVLIMLAAMLALAACLDDDGPIERGLQSFLTGNQIGSSPDYWLMQYSPMRREYDRIALVFGNIPDLGACEDLAELMGKKHPKTKYRCKPAN